jgi:hypothetical protein
MSRDSIPELSPDEIKYYGQIGDALELMGDWVVWLN